MERETIVREEIVILVSLAVSIILLISNFGLAGAAGRVISDFMEGLFGQMTYLFPFLLLQASHFSYPIGGIIKHTRSLAPR